MFLFDLMAVILIAALAVTLYWDSRHGEFFFDDTMIAAGVHFSMLRKQGGDLRTLMRLRYTKRALLNWTFVRDSLAHGLRSRPDYQVGWHATNIAIHAVNGPLVYAVLRYWFAAPIAMVAAIAFVAHPLAVSSIAQVSGRSSALCCTFFLGSIAAFLAGAWWLIPALAYLGFKSKEEIIVLAPALLIVWRFA